MQQTRRKRNHARERMTAGDAFASGGYGCVFYPKLTCAGTGTAGKTKRTEVKGAYVSKLMLKENAIQEYNKIKLFKKYLQSIPNYSRYFLINDVSLCKPTLTKTDVTSFKTHCKNLAKHNITRNNIFKSETLNKMLSLNLPHGGIPVDDYMDNIEFYAQYSHLHEILVELLQKGIRPMNSHNVYHCDIKPSNILISADLSRVTIIDWGLAIHVEKRTTDMPTFWSNRPVQFNIPLSAVIFSNRFKQEYESALSTVTYGGSGASTEQIEKIVYKILYGNNLKEITESLSGTRDTAGRTRSRLSRKSSGIYVENMSHYRYINRIMTYIHAGEGGGGGVGGSKINPKNAEDLAKVNIQFTTPAVVKYMTIILKKYTSKDGVFQALEYLHRGFLGMVDSVGFITNYLTIFEQLTEKQITTPLSTAETKLRNLLKALFLDYMFVPHPTGMTSGDLDTRMREIGEVIQNMGRQNMRV